MHALPVAGHWSHLWDLDPQVVYLNHGSFGATPRQVLAEQQRLRSRLESEPVRFFLRELEPLLATARHQLAGLVGADPDCLAPVGNATTGVNTVLANLRLDSGDELLVTNHEYNACRNAVEATAGRTGARVVVAEIPFPVDSSATIIERVLDRVSPRTRLLLIDHVTSQTGLVMPVQELGRELEQRGVAVLVDGAHAPGMLPLDLQQLAVSYYTGNCHKWLCAPKGAGFLAVREDLQRQLRPLVISHGASGAPDGRFRREFDWTGTADPTAFLTVADSIRLLGSLLPEGWPELQQHNHRLVLEARSLLCRALGIDEPCPPEMIGSMAALPIADGSPGPPPAATHIDELQELLYARHRIEVPVISWPAPPRRLLRISAQLYNSVHQYRYLAEALLEAGISSAGKKH